jgi:hypothetical protein
MLASAGWLSMQAGFMYKSAEIAVLPLPKEMFFSKLAIASSKQCT